MENFFAVLVQTAMCNESICTDISVLAVAVIVARFNGTISATLPRFMQMDILLHRSLE